MITNLKWFMLFCITIIAISSCNTTTSESETATKMTATKDSTAIFYIGTYTNDKSEGIYKYQLSPTGELKEIGLVAKTENPSFLAISSNGQFLIAVNENEKGSVESYSIAKDSLNFITKSSSGGAHPCFVAINSDNYILTANYTGGNVGLLRLSPEGKLSELLFTQQHKGKGTTPRQEAPHAHSAWFEPSSNNVFAVDLGTNELWISELNKDSSKLVLNKKLMMNKAAGPRHLCFHPNSKWIYVVNELDCTVALVEKKENNALELKESISTLPADYKDANTCADIHISDDGKFVYASNRGHNSIAIFGVTENGELQFLKHEPTKGDGPRNFALSPDGNYLIVANQKTNNLVSFQRDKTTGLLSFVNEIAAPTPVCIAFE